MSLQEKLKVKKAEVTKVKIEQTDAAKQERVKDLDERLATSADKRKTIAVLSEGLKARYAGAGEHLEEYKGKKGNLQKTYEEYKDVLEEEGVHDFSGMLEENKNEPEVAEYHQLGGRGPARDGGEGQTGRLYREVNDISEMKAKLIAAVPDLKLNFTGGKEEGKTSQREEAFKKIADYLVTLDQEIVDMTNERLEAYQDTVAGKREAVTQELEPQRLFNRVDLNDWNDFHLTDKVFQSVDQHGAEAVKEILLDSLKENLEAKALDRKKEEERKALENYPKLKNVAETHYNWQEFNAVKDLSYKATFHLAKIMEENEEVSKKFSNQGLSGQGSDERFRNQDPHFVRAARFLDYASQVTHIAKSGGNGFDNFEIFSEVYNSHSPRLSEKKFSQYGDSRDRVYSPEYMAAVLKNFRVFFEKILAADAQTEFFDPEGLYRRQSAEKTPNLIDDLNQPEFRQEAGMVDIPEGREKYLSLPDEYIRSAGRGDFSKAMETAQTAERIWREEKKNIDQAAELAINQRWTEGYNDYYQKNNEKELADLNSQEKLVGGLRNLINSLEGIDARYYAGRIIKLEGEPAVIKDITGVNESQAYEKAWAKLQTEIRSYLDPKIATLKGEILKIEKGWGFKKDEKKKPLQEKLNHLQGDPIYGHYNSGEYAKKEYHLTDGELDKLKELHDEHVALTESHRKEGDEAYRLKDRLRYIEIRGIRQVSPLYGQEMSVKEMMALAEKMKQEGEEYLDNLPGDLKGIKDESDRAKEAAAKAKTAYDSNSFRYRI